MTKHFDAVIVGAGFGGLYALHRLRSMGLTARVYDGAGGVGGTWFWNAYPGARCDVESLEYAYSFDDALTREWNWTERYATRAEILRYLQHVVERFDLARDIQLNTRVHSARYQDAKWTLQAGDEIVTADFVIMATGCLSKPNKPTIPGIDAFAGQIYHTGQWPQTPVDFKGKRVAVIGSGSSGVQIISEIAPQAAQLTVFQRTPHWVVRAGNRPLLAADLKDYRDHAAETRESMKQSFLGMRFVGPGGIATDATPAERAKRYQTSWDTGGACFLGSYEDLLVNMASNATAREFLAGKIRSIVKDPATAAKLTPAPDSYALGAKRLVQDDRYYETYNRSNVKLVDTRQEPIQQITANGVVTASGEYPCDIIVFATGFDAVTGALLSIDVIGRDNLSLRDKWKQGPLTYLGVGIAGFPNFFTITGPGSPSVVSNMVLSIEQHVEWIAELLRFMKANDYRSVEPLHAAEAEWRGKVADIAQQTLFLTADSWYVGANVPGKPRVFMAYLGGVGEYRKECDAVAQNGYRGFAFA